MTSVNNDRALKSGKLVCKKIVIYHITYATHIELSTSGLSNNYAAKISEVVKCVKNHHV